MCTCAGDGLPDVGSVTCRKGSQDGRHAAPGCRRGVRDHYPAHPEGYCGFIFGCCKLLQPFFFLQIQMGEKQALKVSHFLPGPKQGHKWDQSMFFQKGF